MKIFLAMKKRLAAGVVAAVAASAGAVALLQPVKVEAVQAQKQTFSTYLQCRAEIDANSVTVSSAVTGKVLRVYAVEGRPVEKGTLLIELDNSDAQRTYEQAKLACQMEEKAQQQRVLAAQQQNRRLMLMAAQLAGADLEEYNAALGTDAISRQLLEKQNGEQLFADEQLRIAQLNLEAAQDHLELYRYTTVFDGTVGEVYVDAGQIITAGTPLVRIERTGDTCWEVKLTQSQAESLQAGMQVEMRAAEGQVTCAGVIRTLDKHVSYNALGTLVEEYVARVVPQSENREQPGTHKWEMKVLTGQTESVAVPLQCVVQKGGQMCVYTVRDGRTCAVTVETGRIHNGYVEILSGLEEGETLVKEPAKIGEGKKVIPV